MDRFSRLEPIIREGVLRNVDIIVGGHSHTNLDDYTAVKDLDGKEVVIVQDGSWGLEIGQLTLNF